MSPYEIVNLIVTIERHDPDLIPFTFEAFGDPFMLVCISRQGGDRHRYGTVRDWFVNITSRGIQIPDSAFNLYIGLDDVKNAQKALRS